MFHEAIWLILLAVILSIAFSAGCVIVVLFVNERIRKKSEQKRLAMENRVELAELFVALEFIIKTESDLYEQYLINNTGNDFTNITNTEFNNIYQTLSMQCLKAISNQFWESAEVYISRETVQTYVTQRVFNYLADKIHG